jgi:hypothetical protein
MVYHIEFLFLLQATGQVSILEEGGEEEVLKGSLAMHKRLRPRSPLGLFGVRPSAFHPFVFRLV